MEGPVRDCFLGCRVPTSRGFRDVGAAISRQAVVFLKSQIQNYSPHHRPSVANPL